jgi:hypothetical protein
MPTQLLRNRQGFRVSLCKAIIASTSYTSLIPAFSLIASEATTGRNSTFFQSLAFDKELGATQGIDAALRANHLDALVLPAAGLTTVPAGMVIMLFLRAF